MKKLYVIVLITGCMALADTSDMRRRYSGRELARSRPDLFTRDQIADMMIAVEQEPEIQSIKTIGQFIAHIESKLAGYQSLLKKIEQRQANDREGTEEKFEAERAKGGPEYDGLPPYVFYERDKAHLRKKIQNAENELSILQSCSMSSSTTKQSTLVPEGFYDDFLRACSNYDVAVSHIPALEHGEQFDMDTRSLRMVLQQFEKLKLKHKQLAKPNSFSKSEDEALYKFFEGVESLLHSVIYLVGPSRIRKIKNIKVIDMHAKKALASDEPGIILMKILKDKIGVVARFNGRYATMLDDVAAIIERHLNMCFY